MFQGRSALTLDPEGRIDRSCAPAESPSGDEGGTFVA
jgi:hypothetical protein